MRVKVSLRVIVKALGLENVPVRDIFSNVKDDKELFASSIDLLEKAGYTTLKQFQEAGKSYLITVLGSYEMYAKMKEALNDYIEALLIKATYVTEADDMVCSARAAFGELAEDAAVFFYPAQKIQDAISRLSNENQEFLKIYYGLNGTQKLTENTIMKKFSFKNSSELEDYKEEVIKNLIRNFK